MAMADRGEKTLRWLVALFWGQVAAFATLLSSMLVPFPRVLLRPAFLPLMGVNPDGLVSIYPMHVDNDEVRRQMRESGFSLAAEKYEGNVLVFRKAGGGRC